MKLKLLGLLVASVVFTSVFHGCATTDHKSVPREPTSDITITGSGVNQHCKWKFTQSSANKKLLKGSLEFVGPPGICKIEDSQNRLYIGDEPNNVKEVLEIGAVHFITVGTCRYCYTNTSGGMTCVTHPGNC